MSMCELDRPKTTQRVVDRMLRVGQAALVQIPSLIGYAGKLDAVKVGGEQAEEHRGVV